MRELATLSDPNSVLKAVSGLFFEYSFFFLFSFVFLSVFYSTAAVGRPGVVDVGAGAGVEISETRLLRTGTLVWSGAGGAIG